MDLATRPTRARPRPERGRRSTARSRSSRLRGSRGRLPRTASSRPRRPAPDDGGSLARTGRELDGPRPRKRDDEIEAVEQRARQPVAIPVDLDRRAAALDGRVATRAARAEVHGRDELKAGREHRAAADARDRDRAVLERLPQCFEHRPGELGQLVEQQHAVMSERRLAGPGRRTPAYDRRRRCRVMRGPERRNRDQACAARQADRRPSGSG